MVARFKLDENIARDAEALLRDAGHDVQSVFDEPIQSIENTFALLRGALALLANETAEQRLWIVEHDRVRIRDR